MNCPQCVYSNPEGVKFCLSCGEKFIKGNSQEEDNSFFYEFAHYVDMVPKLEQSVEPKIQNIFSRVFRNHSELEAERLFIVGTALTTPKISEVKSTWPKPWLFARVFIISLLAFVGLHIGFSYFSNINFIPGLIIVGAFAVPLTTLIFFWEMNAPQNIAFYRIIFVVFIGGIVSLLVALVFFDILKNIINPITIGIAEELAKAITVISFVKYRKYRYILNGLLIGAAVGAGFAAFETAGYALRALLSGDTQNLYTTILWRGILAPGGHVAWAGLTGAAFCRVQGDQPFNLNMLFRVKFLRVFILVVLMHALWDTPITGMFPYGHIFLMITSWIVVFLLIRAGLKEISEKIELQRDGARGF
ncbi:PrsW family glutamic-type intramembrane protease [Neobacillus drentensis]|uniref:PrsW family glutamic-type intramembrane protease n=1 Tax=Neobacillus drentensis TaxID=220684 RepID=UPI002857658C|nr:PrsW family glutamic-type intramembrane protease [Neobacillus drentensis]MDR7239264.1 RsiW-degrading membrane proteinase PrsW (M82 family) [Neobacillus drentensis]